MLFSSSNFYIGLPMLALCSVYLLSDKCFADVIQKSLLGLRQIEMFVYMTKQTIPNAKHCHFCVKTLCDALLYTLS